MTIAVACNLADGLVLGADSAVTIQGSAPGPTGPVSAILKVYNDAEKLFQLYELPIGMVTYGLASMGKRTIQSYVREFEAESQRQQIEAADLQGVSQRLWEFLNGKYRSSLKDDGKDFDTMPPEARPALGLLVGGFGPGEYLSELWELRVHADSLSNGVVQRRQRGSFGGNWKGTTEGIVRFHKGMSFGHLDQVIKAVLDHAGAQMTPTLQTQIMQIMASAEYSIPFDGMPLQEGVCYVRFLLDMMIYQTRFVVGAPTCGGRARMAVIQRDRGFEWVTATGFDAAL